MLTCDKITCQRGGRVLFQNLSLSLEAGEMALVRGANGSGKTTLLKTVAGLFVPQNGAVLWDKKNIRMLGADYYHDCAFIGHKTGMKALATVKENLKFYATLYGTEEMLPAAIRYFKLDDYADTRFAQLSQGWQRRVALARLMLSNTALWLLDEPWSNLDDEGAQMLTNMLAVRLDQGGMALVSNHGDASLKPAHEVVLKGGEA
jgi:heme exporter protein A